MMENAQGQEIKGLSLEGLKGTTPKGIKTAYRTLMGIAMCWGVIQPQFPEIPEHTVSVINRLVVVGVPLIYAICQTFGWSKPE